MSWDNTTLFVDDDPADRAFRQEVREWMAQNLPAELCNRPSRIDPPELKPWHRAMYCSPHGAQRNAGRSHQAARPRISLRSIRATSARGILWTCC